MPRFVDVLVEFDKSQKESDDETSRLVSEGLLYLDMLKLAYNILAVTFSLMQRHLGGFGGLKLRNSLDKVTLAQI